jgi:hypothetical protein
MPEVAAHQFIRIWFFSYNYKTINAIVQLALPIYKHRFWPRASSLIGKETWEFHIHRGPVCHARPCLQLRYLADGHDRGGKQVASLRHKRAGLAENAEKEYLK